MDGNDQIPEDALSKALEWLRKKYPIDEASAAESWAEAESQKLGQQYIERAERLGLYKKIEPENQDDGAYSTTLTGRSALEELRDFHKKRREDEKQEKMKTGEYQREQSMQLAKQEEREQAKMELYERIEQRREARRKKGMVSEEEEVPNKSRACDDVMLPEASTDIFSDRTLVLTYFVRCPDLLAHLHMGYPVRTSHLGEPHVPGGTKFDCDRRRNHRRKPLCLVVLEDAAFVASVEQVHTSCAGATGQLFPAGEHL